MLLFCFKLRLNAFYICCSIFILLLYKNALRGEYKRFNDIPLFTLVV